MSVTCIGGHEVADWPCWNSKPQSCARKCARKLKCGNHSCALVCHSVPKLDDMQQQPGCANCELGCSIARPVGCVHACPKGCHPPPCPLCGVVIRRKCHCGLIQVVYKCSEFFQDTGTAQEVKKQREKMHSCGNRCLKNVCILSRVHEYRIYNPVLTIVRMWSSLLEHLPLWCVSHSGAMSQKSAHFLRLQAD